MNNKQKNNFWKNDDVSKQELAETVDNLSTSEIKLFLEKAKETNMILPERLKRAIANKLE